MKRKKILDAMNLIDDKYIEEASPGRTTVRHRPVRIATLAACFIMMFTALNLWLFLPMETFEPKLTQYKGSEYYEVIEKINFLTGSNSNYKNNFSKIMYGFVSLFSNKSSGTAAGSKGDFTIGNPTYNGSSSPTPTQKPTGSYVETTDNQTQGVIEADLIKRSDKYIYYMSMTSHAGLKTGMLDIYSIAGEDTQKVGSYTIALPANAKRTDSAFEFYLSEDCSTITVIYYYGIARSNYTTDTYIDILSLDISDPENIREKNKVTITGSALDSRMTDGKLLLVSKFIIIGNDFSDEHNFLPQIDTGNGFESIPAEDIVISENAYAKRYTAVWMFDAETLEPRGCTALLSYSDICYVSADSLYITHEHTKNISRERKTDIYRISYAGEKLENVGYVTVDGYANDQYSFDQKDGVLRAVTTTSNSASLYCIDIAEMNVISSAKNFAPKGETVRSVRFDGNTAYVCTAIQSKDPVFFFDLSDPYHITYKDTGTIPGFSISLINYGDLLLGIGENQYGMCKLELYEESETDVISVAKYITQSSIYATKYKSYFIDRERNLIGICVAGKYLLLGFNGYGFYEELDIPLEGTIDRVRAVYIDGYFYIFSDKAFEVHKIG